MTGSTVLTLLAGLVGLIGCSKKSEKYCALHAADDPANCPVHDGPRPDVRETCTASAQCVAAGAQVCDLSIGTCVECTTAESTPCTGSTPACVGDVCAKCTQDDQCSSLVCLPDGTCAAADSVLYASPSGSSNAACTTGAKCSLVHAVSQVDVTHTVVKLDPGTYSDATTLSLAVNVMLTGHGATIDRTGGNQGPTISISGNKTIVLDYVTITGGDDGLVGHGVDCTGGTVLMHGVHIGPNAASGVHSDSCTMTIDHSTISDNLGNGVVITSGAFALSQSTIATNLNGGINLSASPSVFSIANNFIKRNGNSNTGTTGGVVLPFSIPPSSSFAFNTIVDNAIRNTALASGGVTCDDDTFTVANNLIARNFVANDPARANSNFAGACSMTGTLIAVDATPLHFVAPDTSPYDYHLTMGSSAIDQGSPGTAVTVDFDGEDRPHGAASDIGADELYP